MFRIFEFVRDQCSQQDPKRLGNVVCTCAAVDEVDFFIGCQ